MEFPSHDLHMYELEKLEFECVSVCVIRAEFQRAWRVFFFVVRLIETIKRLSTVIDKYFHKLLSNNARNFYCMTCDYI